VPPHQPAPRLLLLDFDGTLADSYPAFVEALQHTIAHHGLHPIDADELEAMRGGHGRDLMRRLGVRWWQLPAVASTMKAQMGARAGQLKLFAGIERALAQLHAHGTRLAVVTSNAEPVVRTVLGASAVQVGWFECGVAMFGKSVRFRRVLRAAGLPGGQALAVGDELRDLEAAQEAGIPFAAVAWGYTRPEAFEASGVRLLRRPVELARLSER
jgi:phosphoglycolate phosphatase